MAESSLAQCVEIALPLQLSAQRPHLLLAMQHHQRPQSFINHAACRFDARQRLCFADEFLIQDNIRSRVHFHSVRGKSSREDVVYILCNLCVFVNNHGDDARPSHHNRRPVFAKGPAQDVRDLAQGGVGRDSLDEQGHERSVGRAGCGFRPR